MPAMLKAATASFESPTESATIPPIPTNSVTHPARQIPANAGAILKAARRTSFCAVSFANWILRLAISGETV